MEQDFTDGFTSPVDLHMMQIFGTTDEEFSGTDFLNFPYQNNNDLDYTVLFPQTPEGASRETLTKPTTLNKCSCNLEVCSGQATSSIHSTPSQESTSYVGDIRSQDTAILSTIEVIERESHELISEQVVNDQSSEVAAPDEEPYNERYRCFKLNCIRTFVSQDELEVHVKRHHEGIKYPCKCDQCGKAFQWSRDLEEHKLKHSGELSVWCDVCGKGFRTRRLSLLHMKTKHTEERHHKCTECEKSFISKSKLTTHMATHTKVYPYTCGICGEGFVATTFLNFHMAKHMEANPFQCATCGKVFSTPRNLQVHQFTHTQSHPYKCPVCQTGSPSKKLLDVHMLKHTEKSNTCEICDKTFRFPSSLRKHRKVHDGDMRFKCELCSKAFIDKYKLTRHHRTHTGEKPFQCSTCLKAFGSKDYLEAHEKIHKRFEEATANSGVSTQAVEAKTNSNVTTSYHQPYPALESGAPTSISCNSEDTLAATIELDHLNFTDQLLLDCREGANLLDITDISLCSTDNDLIMPTFQLNEGSPEIASNQFCTYPFQSL